MPKRKKRRLNESEDELDITSQVSAVDNEPSDSARPERRLEAKFQPRKIPNASKANPTERALLMLLGRICTNYSNRSQTFSQSLVNHHLSIFSLLGLPVELSAASSDYKYANAVGAHSACTTFIRANTRRDRENYHLTEIVRLFERVERISNNYAYLRNGLALTSFKIKRNTALLFRTLMTLNSLITSRKWTELGRYLNSCHFLHVPLTGWFYDPQTMNKVTYREGVYRSLRHDMFISALFVWQVATLRVLHMEESREWASSRQLTILRRAVSQCTIVTGVKVPEHILMADSVVVMLSLEEAYMIHHFHVIDLELPGAHEIYRRPYEAIKLLAQCWCWQEDLRIISGVTEPGSLLIDQLIEVAEREGSTGVVFALSALRGFAKISEAAEDNDTLGRLLAYAIACPRAARPLAAQMREYGNEDRADELIEKAITPSAAIHPSDPVWLEWAECRMREVDEGDEQTCGAVAEVLLAYLDYGSNRLHERAWILLEKALAGSDSSRWGEWWEERADWWTEFHADEMEKRGTKARKKVLKRFKKLR